MNYTYLAIALYLLLIMWVGFYFRLKSSQSINHFFLGNRTLNYFAVALSAVVSGRSSWLILGVTGTAFLKGISAIWVIPGYTFAEFLMFLFIAPKLRNKSEKNDDLTIIDFFTSELGDKKNILRISAIFVIVLFFISYISAQLGAGHKTFQTLFELDSKIIGIIVTAVIIGIYTSIGGYLAVCIIDSIQAIFMIIGLVVLPIAAFFHFGSIEFFSEAIKNIDVANSGKFLAIGTLFGMINGLAIGLGSPGQPHILTRYMSINDSKKLKLSCLMGTLWNILMGLGAIATGILGRAVYRAESALPLGDKETLFLKLSMDTFHPFLAGLIIAALLAAIMSTVDSQILIIVSSITNDFLKKILWKDDKKRNFVRISKLTVIIVLLTAVLLGFAAQKIPGIQSIYNYVLLAWAALGAAFGPPLILIIIGKFVNTYGAVASIISGPVLTIVFKFLRTNYPQSNMPYELIPAFFLSLLFCIVVSFIAKNNKARKLRNRTNWSGIERVTRK